MAGINGYRSFRNLIMTLIDSLLILEGFVAGAYIRFWGQDYDFTDMEYPVVKIVTIILVIEAAFYYFDLYDLKKFQEKKTVGVLLLESLAASSIFLALVYYLIPFLSIGRGIFAISLLFIYLFTFISRLFYGWVFKKQVFMEKILIVGTGKLAKSIKRELLENGHEGFKIVGFIDESREKVGERV